MGKNLEFPAGNIKELRFYLASFHKMKWGIDLYRNCKICTGPRFPDVEYPLRANGSTLVRVIIMIIIIIIILIAIIFVIKLVFPAQGHPVGRWQLEAEGERGLLPPGCQLSMAGNSTSINHAMSNGHRKVLVEQCGAIYQTLPFCSFFSKSSFWYGFYLTNENEEFLFYLKYKENMCGSWFASQFTPPIPPPTNQPNAEIWHINVSVPKTKRWIIQIKNFHFCYQKNKTKQNIIPFFLNVRK